VLAECLAYTTGCTYMFEYTMAAEKLGMTLLARLSSDSMFTEAFGCAFRTVAFPFVVDAKMNFVALAT
jgi:hypothetical protein